MDAGENLREKMNEKGQTSEAVPEWEFWAQHDEMICQKPPKPFLKHTFWLQIPLSLEIVQ